MTTFMKSTIIMVTRHWGQFFNKKNNFLCLKLEKRVGHTHSITTRGTENLRVNTNSV